MIKYHKQKRKKKFFFTLLLAAKNNFKSIFTSNQFRIAFMLQHFLKIEATMSKREKLREVCRGQGPKKD